MDYEEIKNRLMKDLRVVGYKLVPDERDKNRNKVVGQNGNDGLVYLADIKYWKPKLDRENEFYLVNGDYEIYPEYTRVEIYYKSDLILKAGCVSEAIEKICKHYGENL